MNTKYEKITIHQLNLMKHALGLDNPKAKPKRGKFTAYRNYFSTHGKDSDWEILVECGVATFHTGDPEIYPSSVFYHVSDEGMEFMRGILGFKIVEGE